MRLVREGERVTGSCAFKIGKREQALLMYIQKVKGKGEQHLCIQQVRGEGEQALVHSEREGEGVTGSCVFKRGKGEHALVLLARLF